MTAPTTTHRWVCRRCGETYRWGLSSVTCKCKHTPLPHASTVAEREAAEHAESLRL